MGIQRPINWVLGPLRRKRALRKIKGKINNAQQDKRRGEIVQAWASQHAEQIQRELDRHPEAGWLAECAKPFRTKQMESASRIVRETNRIERLEKRERQLQRSEKLPSFKRGMKK